MKRKFNRNLPVVLLVSIFVMSTILGTYPFWMPNYPVIESAEAAAFEPDTIYQQVLTRAKEALANGRAVAEKRREIYLEHIAESYSVYVEGMAAIGIEDPLWPAMPPLAVEKALAKAGYVYVHGTDYMKSGWQKISNNESIVKTSPYTIDKPFVKYNYPEKLTGLWGLQKLFTQKLFSKKTGATPALAVSSIQVLDRFFGSPVNEVHPNPVQVIPSSQADLLGIEAFGRDILGDQTAIIIPPTWDELIKWKASALLTSIARSYFSNHWIEYFPDEVGKKRAQWRRYSGPSGPGIYSSFEYQKQMMEMSDRLNVAVGSIEAWAAIETYKDLSGS